jgi:hypothetical protein
MTKWNTAVGDTFISNTSDSLKLLTVSIPSPLSASEISYFPCAELPNDPAMRFADLFITRDVGKQSTSSVSVGHRGGHERP